MEFRVGGIPWAGHPMSASKVDDENRYLKEAKYTS